MTDITENLNAKHDQLIYSLLKYRTRREAASKAGISESTMYRLLRRQPAAVTDLDVKGSANAIA